MNAKHFGSILRTVYMPPRQVCVVSFSPSFYRVLFTRYRNSLTGFNCTNTNKELLLKGQLI